MGIDVLQPFAFVQLVGQPLLGLRVRLAPGVFVRDLRKAYSRAARGGVVAVLTAHVDGRR